MGLPEGAVVVVGPLLSHVWLCNPMKCSPSSSSILHYLLEFLSLLRFMSIESVMLFKYLILYHPFLIFPSIFPSIRICSKESTLCISGQSIRASVLASVLPMSIQAWFPLELTDLISLLSKGLSRVLSSTTVQKHLFFGAELSSQSNSHVLEVKWSEVKSLSRVWLFATPWIVAHQAPPSMGFSRQEHWNGLPFPSPGDLPDPLRGWGPETIFNASLNEFDDHYVSNNTEKK